MVPIAHAFSNITFHICLTVIIIKLLDIFSYCLDRIAELQDRGMDLAGRVQKDVNRVK